jgi:hypothetical protein
MIFTLKLLAAGLALAALLWYGHASNNAKFACWVDKQGQIYGRCR